MFSSGKQQIDTVKENIFLLSKQQIDMAKENIFLLSKQQIDMVKENVFLLSFAWMWSEPWLCAQQALANSDSEPSESASSGYCCELSGQRVKDGIQGQERCPIAVQDL